MTRIAFTPDMIWGLKVNHTTQFGHICSLFDTGRDRTGHIEHKSAQVCTNLHKSAQVCITAHNLESGLSDCNILQLK